MVESIEPNLDFGEGYWRGRGHGYNFGLEFAIDLIQEAREGERDGDFRSLISTLRYERNAQDG